MPRFAQSTTLLSVLSALALATCVSAQSAGTGPLLPQSPKPKSNGPAEPPRDRAVSSEVASRLSAAIPKYAPPPPAPEPKQEEEQPDLRDIDKPKNGIVRLPKYIVQEAKPAVLDERAVHTEKGLTDIAVRRYISEVDRAMNRFYIPIVGSSYEKRAMERYAEDERLKNMAAMADAARTTAKSDPAQGSYILREARDTFMRTSDFGWNGGANDKPSFPQK
jgi:hypothetical protein